MPNWKRNPDKARRPIHHQHFYMPATSRYLGALAMSLRRIFSRHRYSYHRHSQETHRSAMASSCKREGAFRLESSGLLRLFLPTFGSLEEGLCSMESFTAAMTARAKKLECFTDEELCVLKQSLQNLGKDFEENKFIEFWSTVAHIPHTKEWESTIKNVERLKSLLNLATDLTREKWLNRVLEDGHWKTASSVEKPFVVLVTGLNGIRKSTALYQPWFADLLSEALGSSAVSFSRDEIPTGRNSFFRQLDYVIATVCNEEFSRLYKFTTSLECLGASEEIIVQHYSDLKAAIFLRYRTVAELMGIVVLQVVQKKSMNCIMETSGRNKTMFDYVDRLFQGTSYQKLVLHFIINDIEAAQKSVDRRMREEMIAGQRAKLPDEVVKVNQGGPYGSDVLAAVQSESEDVWKQVENGVIAKDWLKATIKIEASDKAPWTARALRPDGTHGKVYTYEHLQCK